MTLVFYIDHELFFSKIFNIEKLSFFFPKKLAKVVKFTLGKQKNSKIFPPFFGLKKQKTKIVSK
jgi:hypothetical protein